MCNNKIADIAIKVGIGVAAYELTALILNKCCGTGLPYLPTQVTPNNALPAGLMLGVTLTTASL